MSKKLIGSISVLLVILPITFFQITNPVSAASLNVYSCGHSPGSVEPGNTVTISCTVSQSGLVEVFVTAYWRVDGGTTYNQGMTGNGNSFSASIGSFSSGDFVEYWVNAWGHDNDVLYNDRDPYSGFKSFNVQINYAISWSSPSNGATIAIPYNSNYVLNPYTFNFDWNYDSIDYAKLELNGIPFDILTGGVKKTSVSFSDDAAYVGAITATLRGFSGGDEKVSHTRTFTFIWLPDISITLNSPPGGGKYENTLPIRWSVTTDPQTSYTLNIEYSDDSGSTWYNIVTGFTETTYDWDTRTLPYGWKYRIRVTISGTYLGQILPSDFGESPDFTINPDIEGPLISNSGNKAYFFGNTGNYLTWTLSDRNPANYSVLQNNSYILEDLAWTDEHLVNISVDGLDLGHYEYKLVAEDTGEYQTEKTLYVDVIVPSLTTSLIAPTGTATLENEVVIEWSVITDSETIYTSVLEYSNNSGLTWYEIASGLTLTSYVWNTSSFPTGSEYRIRVTVSGAYNNQSLGTAVDNSTVDFTIDPDIEVPKGSGLNNVTYQFGKTGYYLTWNLSDRNPNNYSVLQNDNLIIENIPWTNGQLVNISIDGLNPGFYEYTLISEDVWGHQNESMLYVDVILPNIAVSLVSPINTVILENEVLIEWFVNTDVDTIISSSLEYSNNSGSSWNLITSGLNQTSYVWDTTLLPAGVGYRIRVTVSGDYLNQSLGTVIDASTVDFSLDPDSEAPLISGLNNISYIFGQTGYILTWILSDRNPETFSVLRNNSFIINNFTWNDNQPINVSVDGLNPGYYTYKLISEDIWGQLSENILYVNVFPDIIAPVITKPNDSIFELGTEGNLLKWTVTDINPSNYSITRNGEPIVTNKSWINNEIIEISLNHLPVGSHNFLITVYDTLSQKTTDLVLIQVKDTIAPIITILNPVDGSNFIISESLISITYSYTVSDLSEFIVHISLNQSIIIDTGKLDNLSPGLYILNATAVDDFGNKNSSVIEFTITKKQESSDLPRTTENNNSDLLGIFSAIGPQVLLTIAVAFGGIGFALIFPKIYGNLISGKKVSNLIFGNKKLPPLDPFELESLKDEDFLN
ncbi:MAG: hypothetical protein ACW967_07575 [Candidatus Hodarchaeales archaeon]|jgi:hypothetical protein